jgi:ribokinase
MRVAVVGHVEMVQFARVERLPEAGAIAAASDSWEEAAGGGSVAAVQLMKLAGECAFYTALGDDDVGRRALAELEGLGLHVEVAWREQPQRRAFTFVDAQGERTITVLGEKLVPAQSDGLAWDELEGADAVFFVAGERAVLSRARDAATLVATARELQTLANAGVQLDALVGSGTDAGERYASGDVQPPPRIVVRTLGAAGGTYTVDDGEETKYEATHPRGLVEDSYGCGDSFAAGFTFGLARGDAPAAALKLAARCGAACLTGRGPYSTQLTAADL